REAVEAKKMAEKEAKEVREVREGGKKAQREKEKVLRAQTKEMAREGLYNGMVRLQIARPVSSCEPIRELERSLAEVKGLQVAEAGGSIDGGAYIILSIDEPVPLPFILGELPDVESLTQSKKGLTVTLKSALTYTQ
ncbi:hypothetical protein ACFLXA_06295, partial [Chloroflexota bacterium]